MRCLARRYPTPSLSTDHHRELVASTTRADCAVGVHKRFSGFGPELTDVRLFNLSAYDPKWKSQLRCLVAAHVNEWKYGDGGFFVVRRGPRRQASLAEILAEMLKVSGITIVRASDHSIFPAWRGSDFLSDLPEVPRSRCFIRRCLGPEPGSVWDPRRILGE